MKKENIQQLLIISAGKTEVEEFLYNKHNYTILSRSAKNNLIPENLPMGVIMSGFTRQYSVIRDDNVIGEAYIYYYEKLERFGSGNRNAVLDAIEIWFLEALIKASIYLYKSSEYAKMFYKIIYKMCIEWYN